MLGILVDGHYYSALNPDLEAREHLVGAVAHASMAHQFDRARAVSYKAQRSAPDLARSSGV